MLHEPSEHVRKPLIGGALKHWMTRECYFQDSHPVFEKLFFACFQQTRALSGGKLIASEPNSGSLHEYGKVVSFHMLLRQRTQQAWIVSVGEKLWNVTPIQEVSVQPNPGCTYVLVSVHRLAHLTWGGIIGAGHDDCWCLRLCVFIVGCLMSCKHRRINPT